MMHRDTQKGRRAAIISEMRAGRLSLLYRIAALSRTLCCSKYVTSHECVQYSNLINTRFPKHIGYQNDIGKVEGAEVQLDCSAVA